MTTSSWSTAEEPRQTTPEHLTLGWLARRSALWLLIMLLGIGTACCIYAFAEEKPTLKASKGSPVVTSSIPKG